jgi:hypothetical protein
MTVTGSDNTITTTQIGAGGTSTSAGHSLTLSNIGSNNNITVRQDGTNVPNSATINVTGSNSTLSVIQH